MKAIKILAFGLAALLPIVSVAKEVTYRYPAALSSPLDGKLLTAVKQKIVHEPIDNVRYSVRALSSCQRRCGLNDIANCDTKLDRFELAAACGAERGKSAVLDQLDIQKDVLTVKSYWFI